MEHDADPLAHRALVPGGSKPCTRTAPDERTVALEDLDQRRLARTVGPSTHDLAALDCEIDPVEGDVAVVILAQVAHLNGEDAWQVRSYEVR